MPGCVTSPFNNTLWQLSQNGGDFWAYRTGSVPCRGLRPGNSRVMLHCHSSAAAWSQAAPSVTQYFNEPGPQEIAQGFWAWKHTLKHTPPSSTTLAVCFFSYTPNSSGCPNSMASTQPLLWALGCQAWHRLGPSASSCPGTRQEGDFLLLNSLQSQKRFAHWVWCESTSRTLGFFNTALNS